MQEHIQPQPIQSTNPDQDHTVFEYGNPLLLPENTAPVNETSTPRLDDVERELRANEIREHFRRARESAHAKRGSIALKHTTYIGDNGSLEDHWRYLDDKRHSQH